MYEPSASEAFFALVDMAGFAPDPAAELTPDLLEAILSEAARFAGAAIAPLSEKSEREGAVLTDGAVVMPEGWRDLYARWRENGWAALGAPVEHGGQGLPMAVVAAVAEMWNGASMAFGLAPMLTAGAVDAIHAHGSPALKAAYLPKLVSGEWTGTMNLTEPQAGSDLSAVRTRAERSENGTYRIFGTKIYITYGEHDLTDNIVHLVLARLPDAPAGVKGISLFLVPKVLPGTDGRPGARNDVHCHSIEKKLGIHASPTCTMIYGDDFGDTGAPGAIGWLVGEENKGLACMFTMMNAARLLVGVQGVGVADAAYQKALAYARERRQGRSTLLAKRAEPSGGVPIVEHPDVARTLARMKALTHGARAVAYSCAVAIDRSRGETGTRWSERAGLLTPIAKAFGSDTGVEVATLGLQVHGGMGYVEETGAARLLRDARIAPIYEGTNGIQAIDLVSRKLPLSNGEAVRDYLAELRETAETVAAADRPALGETAARLEAALNDLDETTGFLLDALANADTQTALAGASPYLRQFALVIAATSLAKGALATPERDDRAALARFMAESVLSEAKGLRADVLAGAASLEAARAALEPA